jgi:ferric-dicitrate binding protein FerR (iron transport regulator)
MENRAFYLFSKKLNGEISEQEARELNELVSDNPHLYAPLATLEAYWKSQPSPWAGLHDYEAHMERMEAFGINLDKEETKESPEAQAPVVKLKPVWQKRAAAVAAVAVVVISAWYLLPKSITTPQKNSFAALAPHEENEVITRPGSRTKVVLPDGTQVWLNADSKLTYGKDFGKNGRHVQLSGEAYFDVVSNKENPFFIRTNSITVKVTGTAFNVRAYPTELRSTTTLLRGKVEVIENTHPDMVYHLLPAQKLVLDNPAKIMGNGSQVQRVEQVEAKPIPKIGSLTYTASDSTVTETAWVINRLVFEGEPFRDIADKLERWFNVEIVFADAALERERLRGDFFSNENLTFILDALKITTPFTYSYSNNTVIISKIAK